MVSDSHLAGCSMETEPVAKLPAGLAIRTYQHPQDYTEVLTLWEASNPGVRVGRSDVPAEIEKKQARDPQLFLVAEVDGQMVGSVLGGFDGRRGLVYHLAVSPGFRRHGIGQSLMAELEEHLRALGCLRCYLLVTQNNPGATQFYEELGWERMDLLLYGKNIA